MAEDAEPVSALTAEQAQALQQMPACVHCGGHHVRACPRVRRAEFHANGNLAAVEFWPDGDWPVDHIIWPEDVAAAADAPQ